MKIQITNLSYKEIKKIKTSPEKSYFLDMNKLIEESFQNAIGLSNAQYWILNQIMVKKIESFVSSKYEVVYLHFSNPTKDQLKALKELISESEISNVTVDNFKA